MFLLSVILVLMPLLGCSAFDPLIKVPDSMQNKKTIDTVKENEDNSSRTVHSHSEPVKKGDPIWSPIYPKHTPKHYIAETGSLFSLSNSNSLYTNSRSHAVGDIITVQLHENTKAAKSANSGLSKNNDLSMAPLELGGKVLDIDDHNFSYKLSNDNKFSGSAESNQSNSIAGSVTVEVVEVLTNGNLVVRGEKWLTLNTGDEYIRFSGIIRPVDIDFDNTVVSKRVFNARIQYSTTGSNQDIQKPKFFAQFFGASL
ncbi:flagellar L-ring protein [Candidatus Photodesmus blepharus]|uniref:Flagellar L-ring protein n=1 Tax=Candidatus Photodesmus blepharonis TaxID=1179155 RepID=A0A084CMF8_9GAMM|nr:flagellar basal body L-ring protein FlgH [Candidatus Photodesmus blepharus]KEY90987.1 flagellar L-ring protein [Candidatus Photodesmus blepharus]